MRLETKEYGCHEHEPGCPLLGTIHLFFFFLMILLEGKQEGLLWCWAANDKAWGGAGV